MSPRRNEQRPRVYDYLPEIQRRMRAEEEQRKTRAAAAAANSIHFDGSIGCLVNGAGLAMATMDAMKMQGKVPENFRDVGNSASVEQVINAFRIITADKDKVSAILVNISGGIMRCDVIAHGIIQAARELDLKIPIIVRMQGKNVEAAKALMATSQLRILPCDNLDQAVKMVLTLSKVMELAHSVNVDVKFELSI